MTARVAFERARDRLNEDLFPDSPPSPRVTAKRIAVCVAIAILATAIQLLRMWSSLPLESLWSEDGGTWLGGALERGPLDALTTTYADYLQTSSRLVAEPVAELPVEWFPAAMAISGAAIVTGCAFITWSATAGHIEQACLRAALAGMVVLVGTAGTEAMANVTNSIWFILFACFWVLLWRPASMRAAGGIAAFSFLAAVSTIGSVFLLPVWLLRLIAVRDRRDMLVVGGFALGLAVQLGFSLDELLGDPTGPFAAVPAGQPFSLQPYWDWELLPAFLQRVAGGAVAGHAVNSELWKAAGAAFLIMLGLGLAALLFAARTDRRARLLVPLAVGTSLALFLAAGYQRWGWGGGDLYWPEGTSSDLFSRYVVTPTLLMLSALLVWLGTAGRALRVAGAAFVLVAALASFSIGNPIIRGSVPWSEALALGRAECMRPDVSEVEVVLGEPPYHGYPVPLTCARLGVTGPEGGQ